VVGDHSTNELRMGRSKRTRGWCFTLHNFRAAHVIRLRELGRGNGRAGYVVFGREICPSTRRRHLQGYLYIPNKSTMDGVKSLLGDEFRSIHLEPAQGTAIQNRRYCTKDSDYEEYGKLPSQGRRADLDTIKDSIERGVPEEKIADEYFSQWIQYRRSFRAYRDLLRKPKMRVELGVFVLHGEPGVGKTRFVYQFAESLGEAAFRVPDPELRWFDGYNGQRVVIIDDYRGAARFEFLLQLLDIYPLQVPVKGGFVWWEPEFIFLTSNQEIDEWHVDQDVRPLRRRLRRVVRMGENIADEWNRRYEQLLIKLNLA
jgi:hypothetical protein